MENLALYEAFWMQHTLLSAKTIFSRLKWVVRVKNAILFNKILLNMSINSLKGKFNICPIELIHPKHASLKDNILFFKTEIVVEGGKLL